MTEPAISVVVPAHDEERVLGRLLDRLADGLGASDEVIVVCNGCTDETARVARSYPFVTCCELAVQGKPAALNHGDRAANVFPRFYVDADIVVSAADLRAVARRLVGGIEAGAPSCVIDARRSSKVVRAYASTWQRLPYLRRGLLGAGVMGMTESGRSRFSEFPDIVADDEYVRRQFRADERLADPVGTFTVTAPRTAWNLIRVTTRARLGVLQLRAHGPAPREPLERDRRGVAALARDPRRWAGVLVYVGVRLVAEARARWQVRSLDAGPLWERDDSSRAVGASGRW